jgi:hypothetical protein
MQQEQKGNEERAHHVATMIARTIATSKFLDPTEFSDLSGLRQYHPAIRHSGQKKTA